MIKSKKLRSHYSQMKKSIKVSAIQFQIQDNLLDSQKKIEKYLQIANVKDSEVIGLPEECLGPLKNYPENFEPLNYLSSIAKNYSVYLFGGVYLWGVNKQKRNVGFLFDPLGKELIIQDKIVLTPPAVNDGYIAGQVINVVDTKLGKLAVLVCKDSFHRYAGWFFDALMKKGVDIVLIPSSSITVSERSINLWTDTLKTMSMLFNVFIVAPGTVGLNIIDNSQAFGNALIVSPQKVVLAQGSQNKEEVLFAELDKDDLERLRSPEAAKWQPEHVPVFQIRR